MENKEKTINEKKVEIKKTVSKKNNSTKDTAKVIKCPNCGRMVSIDDLRSVKPFLSKPVCVFL